MSRLRVRSWALLLAAAALAGPPGAAHAETLADAIALAYQSNPTLQAQRAQQRSLDETYVQARAGWDPTVSATGSATWQRTDFGASSSGGSIVPVGTTNYTLTTGSHYEENYGQGAITATQPLYTGGRTAANVSAAEASIVAGRQGLRGTEETVIQNVVTAYEDVRRDQQIVRIRADNLKLLADQKEEADAKFAAGQVTRTDTAQADAQLASARALLATASAQLQISRAEYTAVVGQNPGELAPEPALPGLPQTVDHAFDVAEADSPNLKQAQITEQASRARIAAAKAANRPTVSAQAIFGADGVLHPFAAKDYDRQLTGMITVTQPIFTAGVNGSLIRQAIEQNTTDRIGIEAARRSVVQQVSQAWNTMQGDQASVAANTEQVSAAQIAYEGIRAQYRVGLSTTLDTLIQQQTLENAELSLVQARHDEYVAEAILLAAMGRLDAADLVEGAPLYDPARSFDRVKGKGATPWEPLIAALDTIAGPTPGTPRPIPAPAASDGPLRMRAAETAPAAGEPLSTAAPTAPAPGTVSPQTPATLGPAPGPAAPVGPPPPAGPAEPDAPRHSV